MQKAANIDVSRFELKPGYIVQEFGWDEDVDDNLRLAIEKVTGEELADEDYGEVTDGAIIWWRASDGDLADVLVDAQVVLDDGALIWVLVPKSGKPEHVPLSAIQEEVVTAGLHATSSFIVCEDWLAIKLLARR